MSTDYSSHADYMARVTQDAERSCAEIADVFRRAFEGFLETRSTDVIVFAEVTA